jgi:hypothetical protein
MEVMLRSIRTDFGNIFQGGVPNFCSSRINYHIYVYTINGVYYYC